MGNRSAVNRIFAIESFPWVCNHGYTTSLLRG
jgi:hypothetical protein